MDNAKIPENVKKSGGKIQENKKGGGNNALAGKTKKRGKWIKLSRAYAASPAKLKLQPTIDLQLNLTANLTANIKSANLNPTPNLNAIPILNLIEYKQTNKLTNNLNHKQSTLNNH